MNERIEKLLEQCQIETYGVNGELLEIGFDAEKFAQLIVGECARVVDIWSDEVPCSEGYDKFTVGKLKEHFGVEE